MNIDTKEWLKKRLAEKEGMRLCPYQDTNGIWTIGVGRNLEGKGLSPSEQMNILGSEGHDRGEVIELLKEKGITETQAIILLSGDVDDAIEACSNDFDWFDSLDEVRQACLVELDFNMGLRTLEGFHKTLACFEAGDWDGAADNLADSRWAVEVKGRAKEIEQMVRTGVFCAL